MDSPLKNCVVIHYSEIALKGNNRVFFEKKLKRNIKRALQGTPVGEIERLRGRFVIHLPRESNRETIVDKLQQVFGIAHFSLGVVVEQTIEQIERTAWGLLERERFDSFRIAARRAQKEYQLTSVEINARVGAFVQERCQKRVDLSNPDVTCHIEIAGPYALVYTNKVPGPGGLPVGVSEQAVSLLSSGIDSPVASFLMLKRGVNLIYAHFHSQPFTSPASQENTARLVQVLSRYQFRSNVYFLPFIDIQKEIMAKAPADLRVLLYRRYMVRLAERIASQEKATALVTGENVGQVASQTLSNLRVVGEVTTLPILRPLAGFDKVEIIDKAKEIGTFEISTEPYEDCCALFIPDNPHTKARPQMLAEAEQLLDMEDLLQESLQRAEVRVIEQASAAAQV